MYFDMKRYEFTINSALQADMKHSYPHICNLLRSDKFTSLKKKSVLTITILIRGKFMHSKSCVSNISASLPIDCTTCFQRHALLNLQVSTG